MKNWVTNMSLRLSMRSDKPPAYSPRTSIGPNWKTVTRPNSRPPPPSTLTIIHDNAMDCIHVPTIDAANPAKYRFAPGYLRLLNRPGLLSVSPVALLAVMQRVYHARPRRAKHRRRFSGVRLVGAISKHQVMR